MEVWASKVKALGEGICVGWRREDEIKNEMKEEVSFLLAENEEEKLGILSVCIINEEKDICALIGGWLVPFNFSLACQSKG